MPPLVATFAGNGATPEDAISRAHDEMKAREATTSRRAIGVATTLIHTPDDSLWSYTFTPTLLFERPIVIGES